MQNPRDVLMKFLSADVYANALKVDHKLSHPDQELRSEAIYLKSAFLKDSARQRSCMASMDKVCTLLTQVYTMFACEYGTCILSIICTLHDYIVHHLL